MRLPFYLSSLQESCVSPVRSGILTALLLFSIPHQAETVSRRKLFADGADGISFTYPAAWLLNADDDAATAKLRLADLAPPHAVVQLEGNFTGEGPYAGTDFEAGAFAYTVLEVDRATCLATLDPIATGADKPAPLTWHSLPTRRLEATFTVAGTDDLHTLIAAAEPTRCLLFETVLIRKTGGSGIVPLPPGGWASLRAQFASVLSSVRLRSVRTTRASALAASPPLKPASPPLKPASP